MASKLENSAHNSPKVKKAKLDNGSASDDNSVHTEIQDLSNFKIEKIISNNTKGKTVCLQGSFDSHEGSGLVILEKTAFEEENLKQDSDYFSKESSLKKIFHNDIYGNYEFYPKINLNSKLTKKMFSCLLYKLIPYLNLYKIKCY